MKATTFAVAAAFLGSVSADGWETWDSSADPADSKTFTYEVPDDKTSAVDVETSTWSDWSTSMSADPTSTWSDWASSTPDPSTWSDWDTTSADPASSTWSNWDTTSADPASSTWGNWESTSADPSTSWSAWVSTPSAETSDPATWSAWDPVKTVTSTSTQWITVTVYPADGGSWSAWSASDPAASTTYDSKTVVVSSTVTKTASDGDWSAWNAVVATPAADPACKLQVSLSYGPPVWYPTPVIATSSSSATWGTWESDPAAKSSTTSVSWSAWDPKSASSSSSGSVTWSAWDPKDTSSSSSESVTWTVWDPKSTSSSSSGSVTWSAWDPKDTSSSSSGSVTWSAWDPSATTTSSSASGSTWSAWSGDANWSHSDSGISANGDKFGMTYSPYTSDGKCKDASTVNSDIAAVAAKGFTSVRVYSTDCSTLENVGAAAKDNKIKIILGVFISETGISGAQPQVDAISKWAQWDLVELIVVGNEAVFQSRCSASDLAGFIGSAKSSFQGAGYKGAVSTTDELSVWKGQGAAWCDVVDVVSANLYAFFNADVEASGAGAFIQAQIDELSNVCPGKEVYVMESGWPKAGECNGKACPSPENQATAIKGIQQASGAKVVFFSFEDEQWKEPGQFGVEQHWGCGDIFS